MNADGSGQTRLTNNTADDWSPAWSPMPMIIQATIDIAPDVLNLLSKVKWITCYIELEEGYNISYIDISTILLNDTVNAELKPTKTGDHDEDDIPDLMISFDADLVKATLGVGDEVDITVKGELTSGELFEGTDTIKVIEKFKK